MYKAFGFKVLIGFLGILALSPVGCAEGSQVDYSESLSPAGGGYIHSLLREAHKMQQQARALPDHVFPLRAWSEFDIDRIGKSLSMNLCVFSSLMMIEGSITDWNTLEDSQLISSLRGNLILGNLYKYPFYLRCGYDYVPFGRHIASAITPQNIITRSMLQEKSMTLEVGGSLWSMDHQLQGSVTVFLMRERAFRSVIEDTSDRKDKRIRLLIDSLQYKPSETVHLVMATVDYLKHKRLNPIGFGAIECYRLGVGVGMGRKEQQAIGALPIGVLLNAYSRIDFLKGYRFQFEYLYNSFFNPVSKAFSFSPHALYVEGMKSLTKIKVGRLCIPLACITGYEWGTGHIKKKNELQSNCFAALRVQMWKGRISLLMGPQWSMLDTPKWQTFYRVNVSL